MRASLSAGSAWWALRLANMSTVMREWAAVHCVTHMPFRDVLLAAKVHWAAP
jgi:senataxin